MEGRTKRKEFSGLPTRSFLAAVERRFQYRSEAPAQETAVEREAFVFLLLFSIVAPEAPPGLVWCQLASGSGPCGKGREMRGRKGVSLWVSSSSEGKAASMKLLPSLWPLGPTPKSLRTTLPLSFP